MSTSDSKAHRELNNRAARFESTNKEVRDAAKTMQLGGFTIPLSVALGLYVVSLFVPHAGGVAGWQFLLRTATVREMGTPLPETIYAILLAVGLGILTTIVLVTRRAAPGLAAWMMVTVGFVCSVFVYWMRETSAHPVQIGLYLGMVAALIATVTYSLVALRRNPEQVEVEQRVREAGPQLDEVGIVQSASGTDVKQAENPLLIDDRRQRAAERHRHQGPQS